MYAEPEVVERVEEFGVCCRVGRATVALRRAVRLAVGSRSVHSGFKAECYFIRSAYIALVFLHNLLLVKSICLQVLNFTLFVYIQKNGTLVIRYSRYIEHRGKDIYIYVHHLIPLDVQDHFLLIFSINKPPNTLNST